MLNSVFSDPCEVLAGGICTSHRPNFLLNNASRRMGANGVLPSVGVSFYFGRYKSYNGSMKAKPQFDGQPDKFDDAFDTLFQRGYAADNDRKRSKDKNGKSTDVDSKLIGV